MCFRKIALFADLWYNADMETVLNNLEMEEGFPFVLFRQEYADGAEMKRFHYHNYLEITWVESGSFVYELEDGTIEAETGEIVIVNNVEPHRVRARTETRLVVMGFCPELVWNGTNGNDYRYIEQFFDGERNFRNLVARTSEICAESARLISEIAEEYGAKQDGYRLMIKGKLLCLLTLFYRGQPCKRISERRRELRRLHAAGEWIGKNYSGRVTLAECAAQVGYAPAYFSRKFHDAYGMTFSEYVNRVRIGNCLTMLRESNRSVREVAEACGFRNQANFVRIFRRTVGMTPANYRRQPDAAGRPRI